MLSGCLVLLNLIVVAWAYSPRGSGPLDAGEPTRPLVFGHRGACRHRPDHTLESFKLAIEQGADFVEPDLVMTIEGVLVCRHDVDLGPSTDVAAKFPDRKRTLVVGGQRVVGWPAHDFTLAEIKTLRARQPIASRDQQYNRRFEVPTFEEFLKLVATESKRQGHVIGIVTEIKHSTHHAALGLPIEAPLLKLLDAYGYRDQDSPCIIQSFEVANLKVLSKQTKLRMLQLIGGPRGRPSDIAAAGEKLTYGDMMTPAGLAEVAKYAWAIGPSKDDVLPQDKLRRLQKPTPWLTDAHTAGLKVIVYTLRDEPRFLAADYEQDPAKEYVRWRELGVDGVFTDFPDTAIKALDRVSR